MTRFFESAKMILSVSFSSAAGRTVRQPDHAVFSSFGSFFHVPPDGLSGSRIIRKTGGEQETENRPLSPFYLREKSIFS